MSQVLNQMRRAIRASGASHYRISKDVGVSESLLSRFMSGERRLSLKLLERLADYLELDVTLRPKRRRKER